MEYLQYWKFGVIGLIVLYFIGKIAYTKLSTIKLSSPSVNLDDLELQDQKAMAHLRNRAIAFKNDELIKEIKEVHAKFYDIHCEAIKGK